MTGDHFLDSTYNAIMLVSDWPVKDLYSHQRRQVQGHPGRRHGHLGAQRPGRGRRLVRERGRPQRRRGRHQQLRLVPLHRRPAPSSRLTTWAATTAAHRPWLAVGAAEHHHLRRPPAGRRAAGARPRGDLLGGMETIGVAVAGFGWMGRVHTQAYLRVLHHFPQLTGARAWSPSPTRCPAAPRRPPRSSASPPPPATGASWPRSARRRRSASPRRTSCTARSASRWPRPASTSGSRSRSA